MKSSYNYIIHVVICIVTLFDANTIVINASLSYYNITNTYDHDDPILSHQLQSIQAKFQHDLQSKASDQCRWASVRDAVHTVLDDALWKTISDDKHHHPVLLHTSCLDPGSLGNALSEYIETRICAYANHLHYVDVSSRYHHRFYDGFPTIVRHTSPSSSSDMIHVKESIEKICSCPSICHEWGYGLMHKNMVIAKEIFSYAVDSYWHNISSARNRLNIDDNPHIAYHHIPAISNISSSTSSSSSSSISLPFIPDVAIHYRCGDNLVTHYGFLPFRVFRKLIPSSSRTIYIMAEDAKRNIKLNSDSRCDAIFRAMHAYLSSHYPATAIVIIRGDDLYDDIIRLTYAKMLICSTSTFCLWPAIASRGAAYFPLTKLIAKEETNYDYGSSFHWIHDPHDRQILGRNAAHMPHEQLVKWLTSD